MGGKRERVKERILTHTENEEGSGLLPRKGAFFPHTFARVTQYPMLISLS